MKRLKLWLQWKWCRFQAWRMVRRVKLRHPGCEDLMAAWPTTGGGSLATGYLAQGVTTIKWGSKQLVQAVGSVATHSFLIVTRFEQRSLVDNIKLPNGDGLTSTRVQIVDGQLWDVTVRDDTQLTSTGLPKIGTTVSIVDAAGHIDAEGEKYSATVVENGYDAAPKEPGTRRFSVENLILVESQTGAAQS